ncbi:MAG: alpha/beta hydrolase [bacterium]|nr:alpha/beta hydrolase [bacterium]
MSYSEPTLRKITVNGISLSYGDTGGDRQPMLCLHGRWGRWETWKEFMSRYGDRCRIIAPDQRGHGLSDKPDSGYAAEDFARDAFELVQVLDCAPVIAVGHSMGGRVAGHLAGLYPEVVKALAVLDESVEGTGIGSGNAEDARRSDDGLTAAWPTPYASYEEGLDHLKSLFPRESNVEYFSQSLVKTADGYDYLFSRSAMAEIGRRYRPWVDVLSQVRCPVLLMRAAESWCLPAEVADQMRQAVPHSTYLEVPNSDHMVYADNPEVFYRGFDEFLSNL